MPGDTAAHDGLGAIWRAVGGDAGDAGAVVFSGTGSLPSCFPVTDLAAASIAAAGLAIADVAAARHGQRPPVHVDRRLASFWFDLSLRPEGWQLPPPWDAVAGDYACEDGWIRLHTNAPHHRVAALAVLRVAPDRDAVAHAVAGWRGEALETAIVEHGGCAAFMRPAAQWDAHPQGRAVAAEPLLSWTTHASAQAPAWPVPRERPLQGIRILDLTRVLAGPVATRFLAGFGAQVLRIDPPGWEEPALEAEVTLGKRCARLDLRTAAGQAALAPLLRQADAIVHGYRADALDGIGLGAQRRRELNPALVDVSLDAYGWTGPWRHRRGFDSLVQMSAGIAEAGMQAFGRPRPTPLPVQALDHATGYVLAAAVARGLADRLRHGTGSTIHTSLARTALLLRQLGEAPGIDAGSLAPETPADLAPGREATFWGPAKRLLPPLRIDGIQMRWEHPAGPLGAASAAW